MAEASNSDYTVERRNCLGYTEKIMQHVGDVILMDDMNFTCRPTANNAGILQCKMLLRDFLLNFVIVFVMAYMQLFFMTVVRRLLLSTIALFPIPFGATSTNRYY